MKEDKKEENVPQIISQNEFSSIVLENGVTTYKIKTDLLIQGGIFSLQQLLKDDAIEEVMFNNPQQAIKIIHRSQHSIDTNIFITTDEALGFVLDVARLNKKIITEASPVMDGVLADGSRINITIPPATLTITFTIRKSSSRVISILEIINDGVVDAKVGAFLWTIVEGLGHHAANILVVGGTASGKTTMLNAMCMLVPQNERIVTIEDTAEVRILHQNRVSMFSSKEKNITMDMLLKNALRMRPDRILVGEVRGAEARTLFSAMNTGHNGCMGTLHARSARETVTRIMNPPLSVPVSMIRDLDLIVVLEKINIGGNDKRIISEITEVEVLAGDQVSFNQIYKFDPKKNLTLLTGIPSKLRTKIAQNAGIEIKQFDTVIEDRSNVLEIAAKKQKAENSLSSVGIFNLLEKNREHWRNYKGKKKMGLFRRKDEELINW